MPNHGAVATNLARSVRDLVRRAPSLVPSRAIIKRSIVGKKMAALKVELAIKVEGVEKGQLLVLLVLEKSQQRPR